LLGRILTRQLALAFVFAAGVWGQTPAPLLLAPVITTRQRVANPAPASVLDMPVSALRFEPRVDVQARNQAEGQADVSVRGGAFENTGFAVGAVALYDPQTGHYFAELPVPPAMLGASAVVLGAENAARGFNATTGTVAYEWREIAWRGELGLAAGEFGFERQSLYQGYVWPQTGQSLRLAADFEAARSSSDGTLPFGDHEFARLAGRVQVRSSTGETNLFAGYQSKFFGWPNLYTPFSFNETENLQTTLFIADHRQVFGSGGALRIGAYYRRNKDDYEFNRAVPGASNPFQHTTRVRGVAAEVSHVVPWGRLLWRAQHMADRLASTALTFGPYASRQFTKLSAVSEWREWQHASSAVAYAFKAGAALDDTDRGAASFSPLGEISIRPPAAEEGAWQRAYLQYSQAVQLPTYTALKSNPSAGLFRGSPGLGPEKTRNLELGSTWRNDKWQVEAAAFFRRSDGLTDWTFRRGFTARTANPVDIDVWGAELVATARWPKVDVVIGYTWLDKVEDYRGAPVDASFYALNYARHRLTAAITWRPVRGWEIRWDNELRLQADNLLRQRGGDETALSTFSVHWKPAGLRFAEFSLTCENLWDSNFEEVPAVPASRRQLAGGITLRW